MRERERESERESCGYIDRHYRGGKRVDFGGIFDYVCERRRLYLIPRPGKGRGGLSAEGGGTGRVDPREGKGKGEGW